MSITVTNKSFFLALFLVLVLGAGYGVSFFALHRAMAERVSLKQDLVGQTLTEDQSKHIAEVIADTETERTDLDNYFIGSDGVVGFISTVENLSDDSGATVDVTGVDQVNKPNDPEFEYLHLELTAAGSWQSVYHLSQLVESLPYVLWLDRVSLERMPDESPEPWKAILTIRALKRK
jgi:hypothetical protein